MKEEKSEINIEPIVRICKNCKFESKGDFCSNCGQRYMEGRFTLKESFLAIVDQVFNLERGMLFTVKELILRPGITISNYLNKATVRYMHPFRFALVLATVSALLTILSGSFEMGMIQMGDGNPNAVSSEDIEKTQKVIEWVKKYLTLLLLSSIPVNALFSRIIYYKKRHYFAEHLILNAYSYGLYLVICLPFYLLFFLPNGAIIQSGIALIIYYISFSWIYSKFFQEKLIVSFIKLIGISTLLMIAATVSILIIKAVYSIFIAG